MHPTKTGHAVLANHIIKKLNAELKPNQKFATIDVDAVAATDLYVLDLLE